MKLIDIVLRIQNILVSLRRDVSIVNIQEQDEESEDIREPKTQLTIEIEKARRERRSQS